MKAEVRHAGGRSWAEWPEEEAHVRAGVSGCREGGRGKCCFNPTFYLGSMPDKLRDDEWK